MVSGRPGSIQAGRSYSTDCDRAEAYKLNMNKDFVQVERPGVKMTTGHYTDYASKLDTERLKMAMDVAVDGIWDWKIDDGEVFFDQRYYAMAGYAPDEFPASFEEWEKRVHPDDLSEAKTRLQAYFQGQTDLYETHFRFKSKAGDWIWLKSRGKICQWDKSGKPVRMIGTHTDISELKQAQAGRQQSEETYRLFIENAHDCIFITQNGSVAYANPSTERLMGYSRQELSELPFIELVHPDDRPMVANNHKTRLAGLDAPNYYSFRVRNRDGQERLLEINAVQIEWQHDPAVLCFVRDITEIKKMEQQLLQSQKMQAIGTLAGGIAHDFNNILAAMIGYTELCQMALPADGKHVEHLQRVLQAGQRARELVNQILAFSRQKDTDQKPVQFKLVVVETLKLLRASIPATIEFQEHIEPNTGIVMADPTRLHQIVMNLCSNAAQAMQETGGNLEVRLANYNIENSETPELLDLKPGPYIRLTISDNGCGMDADTVKRIFDPYFTTKKQGEGTGLGLSVVHGIVVGMQGVIKVYSEPGEGTTFQVYLPCIEADLDPSERPVHVLPRGAEIVLLVDDEEYVLDMTRELLEGLGYTVVSRTSGVEAFQAFQANPQRFDLVVTDQTMPKLTGIDLAAKVKAVRSDIPVILCSGFSAGIAHRKLGTTRIQALLNKPVLKHELAAAVRTALDNQESDPPGWRPVGQDF